jgi:trehalose 6-phosphate phosphatase
MTATSPTTIGTPVTSAFFDSIPFNWDDLRLRDIHVCLDYDGTLTPIVNDPACAFISGDMISAVSRVADMLPVSIVTGRGRQCISNFLGAELLSKISLAASHGFDIHLRDGEYRHTGENGDLREFEAFKFVLRSAIPEFPEGCAIEENKYSVTVHYRNAKESDHGLVSEKLDSLLMKYPRLVRKTGKMVFEVRLGTDWNKGKAVDWILTRTHPDPYNCFVIYIGDDVTDEDAFCTLNEKYPYHLSIVVAGDNSLTRPTLADYRMRDQSEVLKFLLKLIDVRK